MTSIKLKVDGARITAHRSGPLTKGMVGVPVSISFNEVWGSLSRSVVFKAGDVSLQVSNVKETLTLPPELLVKENVDLMVSVYGTDGDISIPTVWERIGTVQSSGVGVEETLPVNCQSGEVECINGIIQLPQFPFSPRVITVRNVKKVDLKKKHEDGESDETGEWKEDWVRYVYEGLILTAIYMDGEWVTQHTASKSSGLLISNESRDIGSSIWIEDGIYYYRIKSPRDLNESSLDGVYTYEVFG